MAGLLSKKSDLNSLNNKSNNNNKQIGDKNENFEVDLFKGDDNYIEVRHFKNSTYNDFFDDVKKSNIDSNELDLLDLMDQTNLNNEGEY